MRKKIYVVSRFMGSEKGRDLFHFIGFYEGHKIKKISLNKGDYVLGEDYALAVELSSICEGVIYGEMIKAKKLF